MTANRFFSRGKSTRARRGLSFTPLAEELEARTLLDASSAPGLIMRADAFDATSVLVRFADGVKPQQMKLPGQARLGEALPLVDNFYKVDVPAGWSVAQTVAAFNGLPNVRYAQPDYLLSVNDVPNDPGFGNLWGMNNTGQSGGAVDADIDAPEAWNIATGSGGVIVAIIDTGIDFNHPDLAANIWTNSREIAGNGIDDDGNGFVDDVHGYDFANNDGTPMDDNSHGTHVAGTIGAVGNNGVGVAGVDWNVQLMAVKFLDASGSGSTSNAIRALNYAVANGAVISNNSWGGGGFSQGLYDAIAAAKNRGHIFVAAAGNSGANNDSSAFYPANYNLDNVVSVAATDSSDQLASFSNYGATTVDLAAPGVNIYSTLPGGGYGYKSGTSMATPHVTGALALVRDQHPNWSYSQVIAQVLGTGDHLSGLTGRVASGGRLNLAAALGQGSPGPSLPALSIDQVSLNEGDSGTTSFVFTVSLSASSHQTVSVQFATAGASASAGSDFQSTSGTLTFQPGETSKTITVLVNGDTTVESDETFYVNLASAQNANIAVSQGVGAIRNDDFPPLTVSIGDATVIEGNNGTTAMRFTVSLSATSSQTVSVNYATANGVATASADYLASAGSLSFAPGETSKTITVGIMGDTDIEANETFYVALSNPGNANIGTGTGVGTIRNDDTAISINDVTRSVGKGATDFNFTVTLAQASALSVTVNFATQDGSLKSPSGYNAASGSVSFAPGVTSQTISVKVKKASDGQFFFVNLSAATNAGLTDGQGKGTIGAAAADIASLASAMSANSNAEDDLLLFLATQPTPNRRDS